MSSPRVIRAAGALLWQRDATDPTRIEVGLVHRSRRDDWSLPKGKLRARESWPAAAVREVLEETGQRIVLGPALPAQHYLVEGEPKTVRYWSALTRGGRFAANSEVDALTWLAPGAARDRLTYRHDHAVLDAFLALHTRAGGADPDAFVVLRHARAVKRAEWAGSDRKRPLTPRGAADAAAVISAIAAFGIDEVHTSPSGRCLETVAPYAAATGASVTLEQDLAEEGHDRHPSATSTRVRRLLASGGRVLVCSHRPVIPAVLTAALGRKEARRCLGAGLAPGSFVVIHHVRGRSLSAERHDPTG